MHSRNGVGGKRRWRGWRHGGVGTRAIIQLQVVHRHVNHIAAAAAGTFDGFQEYLEIRVDSSKGNLVVELK